MSYCRENRPQLYTSVIKGRGYIHCHMKECSLGPNYIPLSHEEENYMSYEEEDACILYKDFKLGLFLQT